MMWPRGGLLGVCLALLFTLHHGDFAVSSGGPVHGVAAAADVAGAGRYLRASDHGWEHHSHSSAGAAGLHGSIGIGGRKLTELCHTRRCMEEMPVCPRCSSPPEVDAAVAQCREHGHVYECRRHPVTGALHFERQSAAAGASAGGRR